MDVINSSELMPFLTGLDLTHCLQKVMTVQTILTAFTGVCWEKRKAREITSTSSFHGGGCMGSSE